MKNAMIAAVVAVAAGGGAAWYFTQGGAETATAEASVEAQEFNVPEMVLGDPNAPVQVIEYASYTCPHCASFHANQFQELKANYIDEGRIGFTYREVYFDQPGLWASMVARCGGEMRFFGISNMLYEQQQDWARAGDGAAIADALRNIGKVAGLTDDELEACMTDGEQAQELMAWYRYNADADNVTGTPSFIINGEKYSNMSYQEFAAVIDEKLAEAN